jgi:hypothetical protein
MIAERIDDGYALELLSANLWLIDAEGEFPLTYD